MVLPRPTVQFNPSGTAVVNLPTWLWIDPGTWHPRTVTASVGSVSATAHGKPPVIAWLVWHAAGTVVNGRPVTYIASTRNGTIGLMWMDPSLLSFRFVPGSSYPERGPILPQDRLVSSWEPRMAAAFNGAFKLSDQDGGYFYARARAYYRAGAIPLHAA